MKKVSQKAQKGRKQRVLKDAKYNIITLPDFDFVDGLSAMGLPMFVDYAVASRTSTMGLWEWSNGLSRESPPMLMVVSNVGKTISVEESRQSRQVLRIPYSDVPRIDWDAHSRLSV